MESPSPLNSVFILGYLDSVRQLGEGFEALNGLFVSFYQLASHSLLSICIEKETLFGDCLHILQEFNDTLFPKHLLPGFPLKVRNLVRLEMFLAKRAFFFKVEQRNAIWALFIIHIPPSLDFLTIPP